MAIGIAVATATLSLALPARAQAQSAEATSDQAAEQARRAQAAGKLNEAIESYARAYQLGGDPVMLFRMAEVHRQAGHDADALRTFQTYLRRDPQGPHRETAEAQARELDRKLLRGSSGNGTAASPVPVMRAPAAASPAAPVKSPVVAPPLAAPLAAPPAAPPAVTKTTLPPSPPPLLTPPRVTPPVSPPAASPPVATQPTPPAAVSPPFFSAPASSVEAQSPGIDLRSTAMAPSAAAGSPPLPRWVPWTLAATTVALGTGAIISGLSASHRFDDLKNSCGQTPQGCNSATVEDMKSRALRANLLWAATGIAAVATGVTITVNASAAGVSGLWAF